MLQCIEQAGNQCFRKKTNFKRSQHHVVPRDVRHKHDGMRKMRRLENLNELTNHGEKEEDESCDVDYIDLVDGRCESAFTKLYLEPENMTMWNSFVNSSEEEQTSILNQMASKSYRKCMDLAARFGEEVLPTIGGLNASDCFLRISHNLRQILRKNQFPKGELQRQEEELVSFFCTSPASVYVAQIGDSFHRLLLHAVSQYLDLRSQSFNSPPGVRTTLVENRADSFMPPSTSLAKFLNGGKISAVPASQC